MKQPIHLFVRRAGAVLLIIGACLSASTLFGATLAYWQMDEATGASVIQDSIGSKDLTLGVSATQAQPFSSVVPNPDPGPFRSGETKTDQGSLNNSRGGQSSYDELFDMRGSPWTLEGWFRNSAVPGQQTTAEIIAATRNSPGWKGWDLRMQNGMIQLLAQPNSGAGISMRTNRRYDDGAWHHIALQWNPAAGAEGRVRLYVDGSMVKEGAGAGDLGADSTRRFAIGAQITADTKGTAQARWNGDLDEFRFSNTLLEPNDFLCAGYVPSARPVPPAPVAPPQAADAGVQNISAAYRNGQVFIQWEESAASRENLRVYLHTEPITPANFSQARLVEQRIEPHSASDWYEDPAECPKADGPVRGWIIESGASALDRNGGLFVHTVTASDPAPAFFAVLTDSQAGADIKAGQNSLTSAVGLSVAPVSAIWQLGAPTANSLPATGKPLAIQLHSHQGRPTGSLTYLIFGDKTMGWREGLPFKFKVSVLTNAVVVEPYDRVWINRKLGSAETRSSYNTPYKNIETWHYGTSDKIYDPVERYNGTVVNYTERLYLKMLDWVEQTYQTDTNKVYAYGASMGTGVQRLALQNPDRFASVDLLVPFVDWSYVSGSENNAQRLDASCGPMTMMTSDGIALSNRMNLVEFMQKTTRDLPHVIIRVGRQDKSVFWTRKPAYMEAMQTNRHGLTAGWDNGAHGTAMRPRNIAAFPNFSDYDYASSHFALNKSYPAFTRFSMNQNPGNGDPAAGDASGFINRGLDWSDIADQPNRYEVKIQVTHPDAVYPVRVDVTPRNLQNFKLRPGQTLHAQNRNSAGAVVEEKTITVDHAGRATCETFTIDSAQGNMLTLMKK